MPEVTQQSHPWAGREAFDTGGQRVGKVGDVYLDRLSHLPAWVLLHSGRLNTRRVFVPVTGATIDDEGIKLAFSRQQMDDAPRPEAAGSLTLDEERVLHDHYGIDTRGPATGGIPQPEPRTPVRASPSDDRLPAEMVRSEEELRVSTVSRPAELFRIRKVVVTEEVTVTVTLRREEARVERVPVTADVTDAELAELSARASVDSAELVLVEEQPVVEKRLVPYERVRLSKELVTEQRQVTDDVRKERITVDRTPLSEP